jgi:hypothetical protein
MDRDDLAGKPDNVKEKIVQGRIEKRLKEMSFRRQKKGGRRQKVLFKRGLNPS